MVEIIALIVLCMANAKRVQAKGRKAGLFVFYTIILWIGMEVLGALFGLLVVGVGPYPTLESSAFPYVMALTFAIVGGVLSYKISKNAKPAGVLKNKVTEIPSEVIS